MVEYAVKTNFLTKKTEKQKTKMPKTPVKSKGFGILYWSNRESIMVR